MEYTSSDQTEAVKEPAEKSAGVGDLLGLFAAGTVLFLDNGSAFTPPPPTVDNPVTPVTPTTITPPADSGIIPGNPSSPEPASLLIGVIGSACGGIAVWLRRRKKAMAA